MIDFNSNSIFSRLRKVDNEHFGDVIGAFLVDGEEVIGTYQSVRDGVVFTNKRIIAINYQGVTGKKKDFTSIPYSKITAFSLETAGLLDFEAELDIFLSAVGKIRFQFTSSTDIKEICKTISSYALL